MSARPESIGAGLIGRLFPVVRELRVIRYAAGATMAMAVAMAGGWLLCFIVPVLSLSFLANPAARPTLRTSAAFVSVVAVTCLLGLWLGRYLIPYPLVYVPFSGLLLFLIFYAEKRGQSPLLITFLLIAVLVIPLLSMQAEGLANLVAAGILFGAVVTLAVTSLVYWVFPEPLVPRETSQAAKPSKAPALTPAESFRSATLSTFVVLPLMLLFYMFERTGSLLILIFVAMLSQQPAFAKSFNIGKGLIVGNVIGGATALVMYELLVLYPSFLFMVLLTLLAGLVFGTRVFSGKPSGALYGMAYSTLLLVIGSVTTTTGDAGAKVYTRVFQIILAVSYVVVAFGLLDRLERAWRAR